MAVRAVIFDFDGVIVESNAIKDEAFHDLYLDHGVEAAREALAIHLANHGASRFEKFAMMHRAILGREITAEESAALGEAFSRICFERICVCPYVPGAREFLENHKGRVVMALASATPQDELVQIVEHRGLAPFFRHCLGKPTSKADNLRKVLAAENLPLEECLFVGDQISDYQAAKSVGVPFVGRLSHPPENPFNGLEALAVLPDLCRLGEILEEKSLAA